jgi:NADH-quinone oxidoreductase subunit A
VEYIPVLILLVIGAVIGGAAVLLSSLLGPKIRNPRKDQPFECGVPAYGDARRRFSVRFYLVAILFLLFDVEAVFFFPWAVVFREFLALGPAILWSMSFFVAILLVGYWYVLRKGALEWD